MGWSTGKEVDAQTGGPWLAWESDILPCALTSSPCLAGATLEQSRQQEEPWHHLLSQVMARLYEPQVLYGEKAVSCSS